MRTKDIVYIALFAAMTAALGTIPGILIPGIGVLISAQPLGVMLAGSILGPQRGALAQMLFIGMVALGLPILSGGRGGIGCIVGPGGGFLLGWPISAFAIGFLFKKNWSNLTHISAFIYIIIGSIPIMYTMGILWLHIITHIPIRQAFMGSILFIPGELIKAVMATTTALVVKRAYPIMED